jgi:hypothetical protein
MCDMKNISKQVKKIRLDSLSFFHPRGLTETEIGFKRNGYKRRIGINRRGSNSVFGM